MTESSGTDQLVTVIIPVFNTERYIEECLSSIEKQTYKFLEVIMVDDGSTDNSAQICRKFTERDKRFTLLQTKNKGVSSARNLGIKSATGAYITFIDSDDYLTRDMIQYLYTLLRDTDSDVSACAIQQFKDGSRETQKATVSQRQGLYRTFTSNKAILEMLHSSDVIINGSFCKLFRSTLLADLTFNEHIYYAEDLLMNYFVLSKAISVCVGDEKKYLYRIHSSSAMRESFSVKRMTGLDACRIILADAMQKTDQSLIRTSSNRLFMEAIAILLQIPRQSKFLAQKEECTQVIRQYRKAVVFDSESKWAYRVYAAVFYLGVPLGTSLVRLVRKLKAEI